MPLRPNPATNKLPALVELPRRNEGVESATGTDRKVNAVARGALSETRQSSSAPDLNRRARLLGTQRPGSAPANLGQITEQEEDESEQELPISPSATGAKIQADHEARQAKRAAAAKKAAETNKRELQLAFFRGKGTLSPARGLDPITEEQ